MGYYCTVPQCTSLAGKTKNVKFHRFPRDVNMADKWNVILKRGKPYTKYSKVCSLHFTQADYNVTTMGQWKTLSKDAVPSQNLPKLNPDGTVMVIRKSRTVKYKDSILKKESELNGDKPLEHKWPITLPIHYEPGDAKDHEHPGLHTDHSSAFRLQHLSNLANNLPPAPLEDATKREKQDVHIQTDPQSEEDKTYSDTNSSMNSEQVENYHSSYGKDNNFNRTRNEYEIPKDYTKANEDYLPQTNEEYNKEAEKYALERKSHYEKDIVAHSYKSIVNYPKVPQDMYATDFNREFADKQDYQSRTFEHYQQSHAYNTDALRGQQQQLNQQQQQQTTTTMLSEHRDGDSAAIFNENQIKQENDGLDEDKYGYERSEAAIASTIYAQQRIMQQRLMEQAQQVKTEPDAVNGCDSVMQPQGSPYYTTTSGHVSLDGYYGQYSRAPGPELLIAKQNSLAAHSQLWRDGGKRPLLYGEPRAALAARYDDYTRIIQ